MRVAICEDDKLQRAKLQRYLKEYHETVAEIIVDEYISGEALLKKLDTAESYDIYILDIKMLELTGLEVAEEIRKKDQKAVIIFQTSLVDFAVSGYKVRACAFLVKPFSQKKFMEVFEEACRDVVYRRSNKFQVKMGKVNFISLEMSRIVYLESQHRKVTLYYGAESFEYSGKISGEEEKLKEFWFARVHRLYIINLDHVVSVKEGNITLSGNVVLPMSEGYRGKFLEKYMEYVKEN